MELSAIARGASKVSETILWLLIQLLHSIFAIEEFAVPASVVALRATSLLTEEHALEPELIALGFGLQIKRSLSSN